ncbi:MAG: hypothetical protein IIY08_08270 [Cellulosilyticum sp.]|nr:hypothetical protein [Cellulosilyticum sp.]
MYFTALNLKIADEHTCSLCGIELIKVHNRQSTSHKTWLFQPYPMFISPMCHHYYQVQLSDLIDAPTLTDIWPEVLSALQNQFILCHKAVWMIPILLKTLDYYNLPYPNCQLGCTLIMSKRLYPHLTNHSLNSLQNELKFMPSLKEKITPALQTVFLTLHLAKTLNCLTIDDLLETLSLDASILEPNTTISSCLPTFKGELGLKTLQTTTSISSSSSTSVSKPNQCTYSFMGKVVSLTGPLESMTRVDAVKKLHILGATYSSSVTNKTDVVLTNVKNPELLPLDTLTSKLRRALILKTQGQIIDIISEETFLQAIKSLK